MVDQYSSKMSNLKFCEKIFKIDLYARTTSLPQFVVK